MRVYTNSRRALLVVTHAGVSVVRVRANQRIIFDTVSVDRPFFNLFVSNNFTIFSRFT